MTQNEGNNEKMLNGKVEITTAPEDHLKHSVDANQARQSTKEDQQRVHEANKDRHSGSAGGHGDSIEVVVRDSSGHEKVAASRNKGGTEKDIEKYAFQLNGVRGLPESNLCNLVCPKMETGRLRIHDFYEGTKYELTIEEFVRVWNGEHVLE